MLIQFEVFITACYVKKMDYYAYYCYVNVLKNGLLRVLLLCERIKKWIITRIIVMWTY